MQTDIYTSILAPNASLMSGPGTNTVPSDVPLSKRMISENPRSQSSSIPSRTVDPRQGTVRVLRPAFLKIASAVERGT